VKSASRQFDVSLANQRVPGRCHSRRVLIWLRRPKAVDALYFVADFLIAAFFEATFVVAAEGALAAWALFAAHIRLFASIIRRIPSAEIFRFFFLADVTGSLTTEVTACDGDLAAFLARNAFRTAAPIRFRVNAEIFFRAGLIDSDVGATVASLAPPVIIVRSSAICASIRSFCCSNPSMAAARISGVIFGIVIFLLDTPTFCHTFVVVAYADGPVTLLV
jgi:hypothetical protein